MAIVVDQEPLNTRRRDLPPALIEFIDSRRRDPGCLIMVLHKVQEHYRYIPRDVAFSVSDRLNVPLAKIYGVMTFYNYFKLKEPGRHQIAVCMGTACYLKGGEDIIAELEELLGSGLNSTTPDGLFSIEAVRCLGCCGLAPVLTVDGQVHGRVTCAQLPEILAAYRDADGSEPPDKDA